MNDLSGLHQIRSAGHALPAGGRPIINKSNRFVAAMRQEFNTRIQISTRWFSFSQQKGARQTIKPLSEN